MSDSHAVLYCPGLFRLGALRGDVLGNLLGTAIYNCFSSNWTLEGVEHGVCYAHISRELEALIEFENAQLAICMHGHPIVVVPRKDRNQ